MYPPNDILSRINIISHNIQLCDIRTNNLKKKRKLIDRKLHQISNKKHKLTYRLFNHLDLLNTSITNTNINTNFNDCNQKHDLVYDTDNFNYKCILCNYTCSSDK